MSLVLPSLILTGLLVSRTLGISLGFYRLPKSSGVGFDPFQYLYEMARQAEDDDEDDSDEDEDEDDKQSVYSNACYVYRRYTTKGRCNCPQDMPEEDANPPTPPPQTRLKIKLKLPALASSVSNTTSTPTPAPEDTSPSKSVSRREPSRGQDDCCCVDARSHI